MRRSSRFSLVMVATGIILALVPGARAQQASRPAAGRDTVVIASSQEPDSLNPLFAEMSAAQEVMNTLFTADIERDHTWRLNARGALKIPALKDGDWVVKGTNMTVRWEINSRRWSDGTPVTCGDYVFTNNVARNESVPVIVRDITKRIANITCPDGADGRKIIVNWKEIYPFANLGVNEYGALPRHVLDLDYRENPSKLNQKPYGNEPARTVTDGAFKVTEWKKGSSLTVEANPRYYEGAPKGIKKIIWRFIPDTNTIVANMLAGAIDVAGEVSISFDQALELDKQAQNRGYKVYFTQGLTWEHIDVNLDNPLLKDVRVRRALLHGLNRQELVQTLFQGKQPVADTYLPPKHPGYDDKVAKYEYDPDKARALLREAGFAPGPDGILRDAQGRKFSLELQTTAGNRVREQAEQIIQQQLKQIGVEITIRNFPGRVFFGEITRQRKYPALAMYAWTFDPIATCDAFYTSDGIPSQANGFSGQNYPGYKSERMDKACKAASRELDETKRNNFLKESARIFAEDLPALPLFYRVSVSAAKVGLEPFNPTGLAGTYETYNAQRWAWKQ